jgi:hypothetical protein
LGAESRSDFEERLQIWMKDVAVGTFEGVVKAIAAAVCHQVTNEGVLDQRTIHTRLVAEPELEASMLSHFTKIPDIVKIIGPKKLRAKNPQNQSYLRKINPHLFLGLMLNTGYGIYSVINQLYHDAQERALLEADKWYDRKWDANADDVQWQ